MSHSLVIGGTGMLRDICLYLAREDDVVSVIARNRERLVELAKEAEGEGNQINAMIADYCDTTQLAASINAAIRTYGRVHCVISWIHSVGEPAHLTAIRCVGRSRYSAMYFELRGCSTTNPLEDSNDRRRFFESKANVVYREVILGFVVEETRSRWLTDDEITRGVIEAIKLDKPTHVIGTIEPWSARPR